MCVCLSGVLYCAGNIHLGVRERRIFVGTVGGAARGSVGVIVITPAISGPGNSQSCKQSSVWSSAAQRINVLQ